jgi:hypothetical protein
VDIIITEHARFEAIRRQVDLKLVLSTVENPQQEIPGRKNRTICQSKYYDTIDGREMLLRVITEQARGTVRVISVYKTTKLAKYWMTGH